MSNRTLKYVGALSALATAGSIAGLSHFRSVQSENFTDAMKETLRANFSESVDQHDLRPGHSVVWKDNNRNVSGQLLYRGETEDGCQNWHSFINEGAERFFTFNGGQDVIYCAPGEDS